MNGDMICHAHEVQLGTVTERHPHHRRHRQKEVQSRALEVWQRILASPHLHLLHVPRRFEIFVLEPRPQSPTAVVDAPCSPHRRRSDETFDVTLALRPCGRQGMHASKNSCQRTGTHHDLGRNTCTASC